MSRSRNIKPGFFKNEVLASHSPLLRIAFAGLWCVADRKGRLEDRPLRLKIEILPYDNCDMDAILCDMEEAGFITRYEVNNNKYIQIVNFEKHQSPHKNEASSQIPECDNYRSTSVHVPEYDDTNRPDSLNSDSLNSDSLSSNAQTSQKEKIEELFEKFWNAYPKKKDKTKAHKAFCKKNIYTKAEDIISDVERRKASDPDWLKDGGKYIPYPSTYLNGARWEDEIENNQQRFQQASNVSKFPPAHLMATDEEF